MYLNPEPEVQAPHHDERTLQTFGWYLLELPCYPLPTAAFEISGHEGARNERWAPSPWSRSAAVLLAVGVWLAVAAAVVLK